MHVSEKLRKAESQGRPTFSFEFFPPKTAQVSISQQQARSLYYITHELGLTGDIGCAKFV